jgi:GntR family transcriptional regulator
MAELRIRLDHDSGIPIYRQIVSQILFAIARGELAPGAQLPTVRRLAAELSVNPNTIIKAYKELEIRGSLKARQGTGTFVSEAEVTIPPGERKRLLAALCKELVGRASAYGFELAEIIEALKEASSPP